MTAGGVKVSDVLDAARRGRALLAPEIAGYLVLAAADQLSRSPMWLDEEHCGLLVDGGKVVLAASRPSSALEAERGLRELLRRLLEAASGRAPALNAVASATPKGNVAGLVAELESALIPVNRSAACRALSRLARDAVRARQAAPVSAAPAPLSPPPDNDDTDPIAMPAVSPPSSTADEARVDEEDVLEIADSVPPVPVAAERANSNVDVDELLAARLSSVPPPVAATPPPPLAHELPPPVPPPYAAPPAPAAPESATNHASPADALVSSGSSPADLASGASSPAEPHRPSHPSASMRGVDELLQDFMSTTSRKEERVARDLRKMTGVEAAKAARTPDPPPMTLGTPPAYEAPFQNASGAADFFTSTPPPRGMMAQSVAPGADDDPLSRRSTRRKVYLMFAMVALLTLGTVTLLRLEPGFLSGRTADVVDAEKRAVAAAAASIAARSAAASCRATLLVTDVPTGAEVLIRSGVAPVDVERVPTGARLEFVALVDGYAPRRGVVPQGAEWDTVGGKPRFELPIQLEKSRAKSGVLDAWPLTEAGSVVGGQGAPGTVRIVTSPRGAEVWMVAGGAPEAKLEALPCGAGLELLVAGSAQGQPFRRRLRADASLLTPEPSATAVTGRISAK